jgi:hypothetical protein
MKFFTRLFTRTPTTTKPDRASLLAAIRTAIWNAMDNPRVHDADVASLLEQQAVNIRVALSGAALAQPRTYFVGQRRGLFSLRN